MGKVGREEEGRRRGRKEGKEVKGGEGRGGAGRGERKKKGKEEERNGGREGKVPCPGPLLCSDNSHTGYCRKLSN